MTSTALSVARPSRHFNVGLVVGLIGILLSAIGFLADARRAYVSWLAALAAGISLALGCLILVAVTHITGARWFDPLRRLTLDVAGTFPLLALLFVLLLPGLGKLYPWVVDPPSISSAQATWFRAPFFIGRAALYFAIWIGVSLVLRHWAVDRGKAVAGPPSLRERALAAASLPALGLSLTFAAFDWLMSLAAPWVSTVFGVYWFAGGFLAALALDVLIAALSRDSRGEPLLASRQVYALGTLMLTFAVFCAYIAYCQYFIIWIGDLPAEAAWYVPRVRGSWGVLALVVLFGQFLLPLLALLFRSVRMNARILALLALWLLVMHYADTYWLVLPSLYPDGLHPHWLDLSAVAAVAGGGTAWSVWLHRS